MKFIAYITIRVPKKLDLTSFRIIKQHIIQEVIRINIPNPRIGLILYDITKNIKNVKIEHQERKEGESGYSYSKMISTTLDNIINYSSFPLRFISYIGFLSALTSFTLGLYYFYSYVNNTIVVSGFTTIVLLILFFFGIILVTLGIIVLNNVLASPNLPPKPLPGFISVLFNACIICGV